ncbi:hypothetical protein N9383_05540 [Granulosicoccus sp.]|nr:hypothetical protein [Granulosicoccus sp.]
MTFTTFVFSPPGSRWTAMFFDITKNTAGPMFEKLNMKIRLATLDEAPVLTNIAINAKRSNGYGESFMAACCDELTVTAQDIAKGEYWVANVDSRQGFFLWYKALGRG